MHKARIWFMDIRLGLGLSVTDVVSVRHTPEIFVAVFTLTDTRPIYKASNSLVWVRLGLRLQLWPALGCHKNIRYVSPYGPYE